jgi:intracellular multiplication protein IcmO
VTRRIGSGATVSGGTGAARTAAAMAWLRRRRLGRLPIKMPLGAGLDPNEINPRTGEPMPAQGILFLGHDERGQEIWLSDGDVRQHVLVMGTAGGGKSEALLGMAANALSQGSGFIFVGHGDPSIYAGVFALCHKFGRTKDLLHLNFMSGSGPAGRHARPSHRINPLASGSPDALVQIFIAMMDDTGGDVWIWKGRAVAMLTAVVHALCELRDRNDLILDAGVLRDHMGIGSIVRLMDDARISERTRRSLRAYLCSLSGFQEDRGTSQSAMTVDQHRYVEMHFMRMFGCLADAYGHIFSAGSGDIDMADVVLNRRILVVSLPSLEKSGAEGAIPGCMAVALLKGMMASALGSKCDGDWQAIVENLPTRADRPYTVILDDVGYYAVDGMALMAAQARSAGVSMVYGSQHLLDMGRLGMGKAQSIIAHANTKLFMRTEDPDTVDLAVNLAGGHRGTGAGEARMLANGLRRAMPGEARLLHAGKSLHMRTLRGAVDDTELRSLKIRLPTLVSAVADGDGEDSVCEAGDL